MNTTLDPSLSRLRRATRASCQLAWSVSSRNTAGRVAAASLALAASSWIAIPIGPVPVTLQSLAVVLLAQVCGRRFALAAVVAYLVEGALGLPVFAQGSGGLHCILGPTGGYLMGFVGGAYVTSLVTERLGRATWASLASMLCGHAVILAMGATWLSAYVGWHRAAELGAVPFVGDTAVKVVVGTMLASGMRRAPWGRSKR